MISTKSLILAVLLLATITLAAQPVVAPEATQVTATNDTAGQNQEEDFLKYEEPQPIAVPDAFPLLVKTIFSLGIVIGLIYLSVYFFKKTVERRTRIAQSGKLLKTVDVLYLSPHRAVYLLGLPDKILVVGATDSNLNLLSEITDPETVAGIQEKGVVNFKKPTNFKEQLQKFSEGFNVK